MNRKKRRDRQANQEKEDILLDAQTLKNRRKKKRIRLLTGIGAFLAVMALLLFASFGVVRAIGKSNLKNAKQETPQLTGVKAKEALTEQEEEVWQEGWVKHDGTLYAYKDDILTFLFMGIDKEDGVERVAEGTDGGQADALFLLVLDAGEKAIKVIGINRNTMTDVNLYNGDGAYMTTVTAQIAVQHGFGNGVEESCEYQVDAVRKLFYNLPVHGYCAVNMDAVIDLTDLAGGIELTALEDVRSAFGADGAAMVVKAGERIVLDGRKAYSYVRYREVGETGSADRRLDRQKQFLEEFIRRAKEETAGDLTLPARLYQTAAKQMVTDVTVDEAAYLASVAAGYHFDREEFYTLKGETVQGEQFEEYYIDEDALYALILGIFYEPVKME